jgi:DNA-binding transcriptional MerR regulator
MDVFLMTSEVARQLGKSAEAVRYYEKTKRLPAIKTSNGRRLFKQSDVEKLARELAADHGGGAPIRPQAA